MKILHPRKELVDPRFIFYKMQTINFTPTQHKRYWISVYSKIKTPLPPLSEQKKIVNYLDNLREKVESLKKTSAKTIRRTNRTQTINSKQSL